MKYQDIPLEIRVRAIEIVVAHNGIVGTRLVQKLMSDFLTTDMDTLRKTPALLSKEGLLVEIEFIIPGQASQSFFLPIGTVVNGITK